MVRISLIGDQNAGGKAKELLEEAKVQLGMVPNLFRGLATSPAAFESYMAQNQILSKGILSSKLREQIALAVAGVNGCDYCASAHTALGHGAGISDEELRRNLSAESEDTSTQAALSFAVRVVKTKGNVSNEDLKKMRDAEFCDGAITEIISHIALNIFTNYFNHIAQTEIDFPVVQTKGLAITA